MSADLSKPRLCHLKKWPDFEGYGFHLQAMKDSPGQYIGKVDEGSPADSARLQSGDKIIEVNGVNVEGENHQQVVTRIKAVPNETKLLVIERDAYDLYKKRGLAVRGDADGVRTYVTADTKAASLGAKGAGDKKETSAALVSTEHVTGSRLCHLRIRPDFQGYGFNLQAEKGKPGQFIGKVEANSPAEESGLRIGDRLLEVNGSNVTAETHSQVVQRVKAVAGYCSMLVIDHENFNAHLKKLADDADEPYVAKEVAAKAAASAPLTNGSATKDNHVADDVKLSDDHDNDKLHDAINNYETVHVVEHEYRHEVEQHHDDDDDDERSRHDDEISRHDDERRDSRDGKFDEEEQAALAEVERAMADQPDGNDDTPNDYSNWKTSSEPIKKVEEPPAYAVIGDHKRPSEPEPSPVITKQVSAVSTASTSSASINSIPASPGPVVIDGIYFPASAKEAREKIGGKKKGKDPRLSTQLSMTEKYKLFERL